MHAIMLPPATPVASTAIVLHAPAGRLAETRPLARLARRRVDLLRLAAVTAGYQRYNDSLARTA